MQYIRLLLFYSVIFQSVIFHSCKFQSPLKSLTIRLTVLKQPTHVTDRQADEQ